MVSCSGSVHHVREIKRVLRLVPRVLRLDGLFIFEGSVGPLVWGSSGSPESLIAPALPFSIAVVAHESGFSLPFPGRGMAACRIPGRFREDWRSRSDDRVGSPSGLEPDGERRI